MNALEMALEALTNPSTIAVSHAIELIRQALAQPEQNKPLRLSPMYEYGHIHDASQPEQEPVNTMPTKIFAPNLEQILNAAGFYKRQWVGLTDEEINDFDKKLRDNGDYCSLHFAWGISAKLKEKNGGT